MYDHLPLIQGMNDADARRARSRPQATNNYQPPTRNQQPASAHQRQETSNQQPEISKPQKVTSSQLHEGPGPIFRPGWPNCVRQWGVE